jgi:hypothetical protein
LAGVEEPAQHDLDFGGGALGNQLGVGEDVPASEGLEGAGMRSAGEVHGQGRGVGAALAVFGGVQKRGDEVVNEAVGAAGDGHGDGDSQGRGGCQGDVLGE